MHAIVVELQSVRVDLMRSLIVASEDPAAPATEFTSTEDCQHFSPEITSIRFKEFNAKYLHPEMIIDDVTKLNT